MSFEIKSLAGSGAGYSQLIVLLVAVVSFGLGTLSTRSVPTPSGVVLVASSTVAELAEAASSTKEPLTLVASSGGTKYYLPTCSGVARISEANKIYFSSVAEARAAGYTPAANCPGLE